MSPEPSRFLLSIRDAPGTMFFESDEKGIITLKAQFAYEAREFLWLRKGEDIGAEVIAVFVGSVNSLADQPLLQTLAAYVVFRTAADLIRADYREISNMLDHARERFRKHPWVGRSPRDLRILCWPNDDTEAARLLYEAQGYSVRHYADRALAGSHRFYLNERRFCLFLRAPGERFFGFLGDDAEVRAQLKALFEQEWQASTTPGD